MCVSLYIIEFYFIFNQIILLKIEYVTHFIPTFYHKTICVIKAKKFFFLPFKPESGHTRGSIVFFWYIALVRCTIERNGEGIMG